jgi:hypothetical protein
MQKGPKLPKFDFEEMKASATSQNPAVRKKLFIEYFERFEDFPSYLFDNSQTIDSRFSETMQDLQKDPETTKKMQGSITAFLSRMPNAN